MVAPGLSAATHDSGPTSARPTDIGDDADESLGAPTPYGEAATDDLADVVWLPPTLRARIASFDRRVDDWFEPFRGRPAIDAAAKLAAGLSDHGLVWAVEAAWRGRRPGPRRRRVVRDLAVAGVSSSLLNAVVKAVVGRTRPDRTSIELRAGGLPVREPTSSSFPSGHTLAAFCVAAVMADRTKPAATTARFVAAGTVGLSRLHLRAHHASDVLGGMAMGLAVGALGHRRR